MKNRSKNRGSQTFKSRIMRDERARRKEISRDLCSPWQGFLFLNSSERGKALSGYLLLPQQDLLLGQGPKLFGSVKKQQVGMYQVWRGRKGRVGDLRFSPVISSTVMVGPWWACQTNPSHLDQWSSCMEKEPKMLLCSAKKRIGPR